MREKKPLCGCTNEYENKSNASVQKDFLKVWYQRLRSTLKNIIYNIKYQISVPSSC